MRKLLKDKRGLQILPMFMWAFAIFFIAIVLGIWLLIFDLTNDALDQDVDIGQVNLQDINNNTFGKIHEALFDHADLIGIVTLLAMSLSMLLMAYYTGDKNKRLLLVVDFFILIFVFILAVYLSQTYYELINSDVILELFINDIPKTSKFVLNLPTYVATLGVIIMILSYSGLRKKPEETGVIGY